MMKISRRRFIVATTAASLTPFSAQGEQSITATPSEVEGPFYPVRAQKDRDFDLTRIEGRRGKARGQEIEIVGRVIDTSGHPIEDAVIELWQANAAGRYRHPRDPSQAAIDENFQGWAVVPSGKGGGFRFKTIFPGAYPASSGWMRPPHIHFKIRKNEFSELTTQMYFPGHPLNDRDFLLQRKNGAEQAAMIAEKIGDDPERYEFQIVLRRV